MSPVGSLLNLLPPRRRSREASTGARRGRVARETRAGRRARDARPAGPNSHPSGVRPDSRPTGAYIGLDYSARRLPLTSMAQPYTPGRARRRVARARRRARRRRTLGLAVIGLCALGLAVAHAAAPGTTRHPTAPAGRDADALRQAPAGHPRVLDHVPVLSRTVTFAPGACVAYRPLRGDRHRTVFIDAGHGGPDPGASGVTSAGAAVDEKSVTLATARDLLALLRTRGYRVVLSRTGDTPVVRLAPIYRSAGALTVAGEHADTAARVACANAAGANLLVSIHFNTFADPTVGGAETLYDSARPFRAANHRLADLVQADVVASLQAAGWEVPNRGTIDDGESGTPALTAEAASYGHLLELGPAAPGWLAQPSAMPGVLCEPLFVSDPAEAGIAASARGQQAIAQGFARAIDAFFRA